MANTWRQGLLQNLAMGRVKKIAKSGWTRGQLRGFGLCIAVWLLTFAGGLLLSSTAVRAQEAGLTSTPVSAPMLVLKADTGAARHDPELSFLLDPTGQLAIDEIDRLSASSSPRFTALEHPQPHQLGHGALWLRFDALITSDKPHWRLVLPLPALDDVSLYYRDSTGQWVHQLAGDTHPMSQWAQRGRYPVFGLSNELNKPVRYYLQIHHTRVPYSTMPRIISDALFIESRQNEHMLLGVYFGLAMLVMVLALVNSLAYRDMGFGSYALYVALFAGAQAGATGIAALYFWPEWPILNNAATIFLIASAVGMAQWFVRIVTKPKRFSRLLDSLMLTLIVAMPVVGAVNALHQTQTSFVLLNTGLSIHVVVLLVAVFLPLAGREHHSKWIAIGFLPVLTASALLLLRNAGVIPAGFLTTYGLMLGSAIEAPILFYGLLRRVSQRRNLTARATSLRNTDPLTGLNSAKVLLSKLRQSLATSERYQLPFALLLVELTNLAVLQKQHGREAADRAMVMAAARIRSIAHATDSVARVGDTQFALLMEGPISAEAANDVATKIIASGLRPSTELPDAESLRFHIAIGHAGKDAKVNPTEAESTLARMLQTLKDMHDGSRKAIRMVRF